MDTRQLLFLYSSLFVGRMSDYARQKADGSYYRVGVPLTQKAVHAHLSGIQTVGTYLLDEHGCCSFAVADADGSDGLRELAQMQERLRADDIPSVLEQSRRGGHLWVLFARSAKAFDVRHWLLPYCPAGVEFYPKQDQTQGYGSLIRLPLGVHQLSGRRYPFVRMKQGQPVPLASSLPAMTLAVSQVGRVVVPSFEVRKPTYRSHTPTTPQQEKSLTGGGGVAHVQAPRNLEDMTIKEWCAAQDPFALIGRYVWLNAQGVGRCPFGAHHKGGVDQHASFRVYPPATPGGACWFCYVQGKGGNVFNFLQQYHGLDARTLWEHIGAGEVF